MENVKRYRDNVDGRIREDRLKETNLPDGSGVKQVQEYWEEKVPMSLKKRVTSELVQVPIKVVTEVLDDNGNVVDERVDVVPRDKMSLVAENNDATLDGLKHDIRNLTCKVDRFIKGDQKQIVASTSECCKNEVAKNNVVTAMDAKYSVSTPDSGGLDMTNIGMILGWICVAGASAVFLYSLMF